MVDDQVTVPHIKDLKVGDLIKLTRITEVGSRNFTLRAVGNGTVGHANERLTHQPHPKLWKEKPRNSAWIPANSSGRPGRSASNLRFRTISTRNSFMPSAIVVEHTRGKMITVIKKKRRKGYRETIRITLLH
ncbi:hypothetical protein KEM48_011295 [Puccinia striiformis f. sp. tritici PST-130]|nr:hypothetical protein KEM48_011295 [Puccinia striiformis f. sp. tritici PST-130]